MKKNILLIIFLTLIIWIIFIKVELINSFLIIFLLYVFIIYKSLTSKKKIYIVMLITFSIRILFILFDSYFEIFPFEWDTDVFHSNALLIKNNIMTGNYLFHGVSSNNSVKSYSLFVSFIYFLFGSYEINIRLINAFIGSYLAKKAYDIGNIIEFNKNSTFWLFILVSFWPSFIYHSTTNMRDSLVIFLTLDLIIRFFLRNQNKVLNKIIFIVDFILIVFLRNQMIVLLLVIFIIYFISKKIYNRKNMFLKISWSLTFLLSIILIFYLIQINVLPFLNFNYISSVMEYRARGGSAYLKWLEYNNVFDLIKYTPIKIFYFIFGPFIWDVSFNSIFLVLAFIESKLLFVLSILSIKKLKFNNSKSIFLIIFLAIGITGFALLTSNYGTANRHKMTFVIIILIFVSRLFKDNKIFR